MKFYSKSILLGLLSLLACDAGDPGMQPEPDIPTEVKPTEVGKPIGEPVQKVIGPAGGTISTPDNAMMMVIPAGALSKDTPISVQPVENKAWGGTGLGYELSPKNLELAKPAELVWNYNDPDMAGSVPEAIGIAFQQEDRTWLAKRQINLNKTQKRISAPVSRLMPVAFYEEYFMRPVMTSVVPGEHLKIDVLYQKYHEDADWLQPLTEPEVLGKADVRNWRVNGQDLENKVDPQLGAFSTIGNLASASYIAPSRIPKLNEIAISVEVLLPGKSKLILVTNVKVEAANSFSFTGAKVDSAEVGSIAVSEGEFLQISLSERALTGGDKQAMIVLSMLPFPGVGSYTATDDGKIHVNATDRNRKSWSDSYYTKNGKKVVGPLEVQITEYDSAKKRVKGVISGTLHYYDDKTSQHESTAVKARFQAASPY